MTDSNPKPLIHDRSHFLLLLLKIKYIDESLSNILVIHILQLNPIPIPSFPVPYDSAISLSRKYI